jgi:predicted DNA binding CopG/RHH family protein
MNKKLKMFLLRMPDSLHKKTKSHCAIDGKSMQKYINDLVETDLKRIEQRR